MQTIVREETGESIGRDGKEAGPCPTRSPTFMSCSPLSARSPIPFVPLPQPRQAQPDPHSTPKLTHSSMLPIQNHVIAPHLPHDPAQAGRHERAVPHTDHRFLPAELHPRPQVERLGEGVTPVEEHGRVLRGGGAMPNACAM